MNAELKAKWLEALRSGKYKQAIGTLHEPQPDSYCCIGVLYTVMGFRKAGPGSASCFEGPADWRTVGGLTVPVSSHLASMNDNGASFAEIADYIEANVALLSAGERQ